jgi:hypothetical protein
VHLFNNSCVVYIYKFDEKLAKFKTKLNDLCKSFLQTFADTVAKRIPAWKMNRSGCLTLVKSTLTTSISHLTPVNQLIFFLTSNQHQPPATNQPNNKHR